MAREKTPNGIDFEYELAGPSGARYFLMPTVSQNTKASIDEAKRYLRDNFDPVSITIEAHIYKKNKGEVL